MWRAGKDVSNLSEGMRQVSSARAGGIVSGKAAREVSAAKKRRNKDRYACLLPVSLQLSKGHPDDDLAHNAAAQLR